MTLDSPVNPDLPEGWAAVALQGTCEVNPGKPSADALPAAAPVTFVPMPAVDAESGTIASPTQKQFADARRGSYTPFAEGDVLIAKITPCMENGKAAVAKGLSNGLGFGSTEFHVLRPTGAVYAEYVFHFVRQESFREEAKRHMSGNVGQQRVPADFIKDAEIPLPPLSEQKRIVAKVEELVGRVNAARARLAKLAAILKRFCQSVHAAACSGRLTADWRKSNHPDSEPAGEEQGPFEIPPSWQWIRLERLAASIRSGSTAVPRLEPTAFPILRSSSVRPGAVDLSDARYVEAGESRNEANFLCDGDLLFTRLSGSIDYVANCAIVRGVGQRRIQYPDRLFRVQLKNQEDAPYIEKVFAAPYLREAIADLAKSSAGHQRVSQSGITDQLIPLPRPQERDEIVRRVEALFVMANKIEARVRAATLRAEKLTQAILAKAFRGELVPTEAELARAEGRPYESAADLLARIRAQTSSAKPAPARRRRLSRPKND